jgi:hypothetical protein
LHAEQKRAFSDMRKSSSSRSIRGGQRARDESAQASCRTVFQGYVLPPPRCSCSFFLVLGLNVRAAHNIQPEERTIDVHRLKSREAIRRTEIGIRDALWRATHVHLFPEQVRAHDDQVAVAARGRWSILTLARSNTSGLRTASFSLPQCLNSAVATAQLHLCLTMVSPAMSFSPVHRGTELNAAPNRLLPLIK